MDISFVIGLHIGRVSTQAIWWLGLNPTLESYNAICVIMSTSETKESIDGPFIPGDRTHAYPTHMTNSSAWCDVDVSTVTNELQ